MNHRIFLMLIFFFQFFLHHFSFAQGVKGTVTDETGKTLPFATIFVQENGSGTTTNDKGIYDLKLASGNYTLIFQFLGYETAVEKVAVGELYKTLDVKLKSRPIDLSLVEIYEGTEDPAYTIMRKAIAKASFHRQQLDTYEADVYIKGSGKLNKTPRIFKKMLEKEGIDTSTTYVSESVSKIEYIRPNTFKQTVISIYQSGDDNNSDPNSYINSSFYQPTIGESISPLSPKAFAYYKFELEGFFLDRGFGVNKIKVTPRSRGENVFEGSIYIVEDLWSIYSTDLKTYKFGIEFNINQLYAPVQDKVWLPVSHKFNVSGKILGFSFNYKYIATVSNYKITINPDLPDNFELIDEKLEQSLKEDITKANLPEKNKEEVSALDKLASGEEITRKELKKIIKEYEKEEEKEQKEPEVIENYNFVVDSMARKRDSLYWEAIRPIPLTNAEIKGYEKVDSLSKVRKIEAEEEAVTGKKATSVNNKWNILDIVGGYSYKLGEKQYLRHSSLLEGILFNPVEGFSLRTDISYSNSKTNPFSLTFTPRYGFSNERFLLNSSISYTFGKDKKKNNTKIEGGRYIFQYNENNPIEPLISAYINLFNEKNYIRLYEKDYIKWTWAKEFSDKISIKPSLEWANRKILSNTTSQVWFNKDDRAYDSNIPQNEAFDFTNGLDQKALIFGVDLESKPWLKYRIRNGKKTSINSSSPTIKLSYKKGIQDLLESEMDYDFVEMTFQHQFKPGARGLIDFKANGGIFINNNTLGFQDFKHFTGNRIPFVAVDPVGSFRLLDYYNFSTNDKFLSLHLHYQFRKFLLTQLTDVWLLGIKENLFSNYLLTPTSGNYTEVGYSLDNILRIFRIEATVSFQNGKYKDFGVLFGIASNLDSIFN